LGGSGMLGHKMFQILGLRFSDTYCTVKWDAPDPRMSAVEILQGDKVIHGFDVLKPNALESLLHDLKPSVIVNCIGVIKQRPDAEDSILSLEINSLLPHKLAAMAKRIGGRVIHFSTDCVFSGEDGQYTEDSFSDARDLYGKSKFLGEVHASNALTIRTSIIGHELNHFASLLDWFLAQKGKTIGGYDRVLYSGVTTNYLARTVGEIIENHADLSGLYQITGQTISKYDLLCKLRDAYSLEIEINPEVNTVNDRSMIGDRFVAATNLITPSWNELVAELTAEYHVYEAWRNV
jgi:dTDP-4-dehydrorhamnose reductase